MMIPDEVRDEMRQRVLDWSDRVGSECLVPRKRSTTFHGQHLTMGQLWAMGVSGRAWGEVIPGLCEHKGCVVHHSRTGAGEWSDGRVLQRDPEYDKFQVRDHPFHPVALTLMRHPSMWWRHIHKAEPDGIVRLGLCGVKHCIKHMGVVAAKHQVHK